MSAKKTVPVFATAEQIMAGRNGPGARHATELFENAGILTGIPCAEIYESMVQAAPADGLLEAAEQLIIQIEAMDAGGEDSGFNLFLQDLKAEVSQAKGAA